MLNPTFKQVAQASASKAIQAVKNGGIEGKRFISTTQNLNDDKSNCDTGRCSRINMDTKGYLGMPESNYLQPSKTTQRKRFVESKPLIKPEIVYEHEQYCREKEECRAVRKKDAADNVKKP